MQICRQTSKRQEQKLELLCPRLQIRMPAVCQIQVMLARASHRHKKELARCKELVTYSYQT